MDSCGAGDFMSKRLYLKIRNSVCHKDKAYDFLRKFFWGSILIGRRAGEVIAFFTTTAVCDLQPPVFWTPS